MVKVYMTKTGNYPDPKECPEHLDGVPQKRKEKILRYRTEEARKQGLASSLLLQQVLLLHGKDMNYISYGENGKPEIEGIYFNLSHSHEIAVCAVSDAPVGCDVEKIEKRREKVATHFFTSKEITYMDSLLEKEKDDAFYRLWTMKESYMKMTGEGMKLSLKRIEFIFEEKVRVYRDGTRCDCCIKEYEIPDYKLTVCSMENDFCQEIIQIK